MPFAAAANHAASLAPQSPFPLATPPLVGKETTLSKSCGSAGARAEGNGGGERSVHTGTTKDYNGGQWCKWVFTKILLFCYSRVAKCGYLVRVLYFSHRKNRLVAVIVYICARNVI